MDTLKNIEAVRDEYRKAKLQCGDLKGLKNRFQLANRLGIEPLHTYYVSVSPQRTEVTASIYSPAKKAFIAHAYTMKGLIDELKDLESGEYEITLECCTWNKEKTDADRKTIKEFGYTV